MQRINWRMDKIRRLKIIEYLPLNGRCNELKGLKYLSNDIKNNQENIWYAINFSVAKEEKRRQCKSANRYNIEIIK